MNTMKTLLNKQLNVIKTWTVLIILLKASPVVAQYCSISHGGGGEYIDRVRLESIDRSSGQNHYSNYYSTDATDLNRGSSYTLRVDVAYSWSNSGLGVWIDWNQDDDFNDANETVYSVTAAGDYTITVNVPAGATLGDTRMRINFVYTPNDAIDDCGSFWTGEAEDYKISVKSGLPIELKSFDGFADFNENVIEWETYTEINNDFFTIERSNNGIDFEPIAYIDGAGNSATTLSYEFVDENPNAGINYYRLKQTDFDGQFEIFYIIAIENESVPAWTKDINLYPMPANDHINIEFGSETPETVEISIINLQGITVQNENIDYPSNTITIHFNNITTGQYIMVIKSQEEMTTKKLIIR